MREITDTELRLIVRKRYIRKIKNLSKKYNKTATAEAVAEFCTNLNLEDMCPHRVEIIIKKLQKEFNKYNHAC